MDSIPKERRTVIYHGRVQGVGFRATARDCASPFAVTGTVQNLWDGTVLLVAEGTAAELDAFLLALAERLDRYITGAQVSRAAATGEFDRFSIVR